MSSPLISVVIPCHNAADYVGEAVTSALEQTYGNVEVIVVDDASTDGSLEVVRSFGGRVRRRSVAYGDACATRNAGLAMARGKYVQLLDADDRLEPEKLERQIGPLEAGRADAVFCAYRRGGEGRREQTIRYPWPGREPAVLFVANPVQTGLPLHRRSMLAAVRGFRRGLPCCQEMDLHLRLVEAGCRFEYVDEVLLWYRALPGSISSDRVRIRHALVERVEHAYRILRRRGRLTGENRRVLASVLVEAAQTLVTDWRCWARAQAALSLAQRLDRSCQLEVGKWKESSYAMMGVIPAEILARASRPVRSLYRQVWGMANGGERPVVALNGFSRR